ncbi:sensor histidine kinase [Leucobacter sp. CSA2]|uniref:histidine kinase n=1 Tax=Leucobacter edaphi TaxID=2796472 RepID=A0A934UXZ1_9MICO|nr:histidine kinase [Leucobacter edaphi]MBK0421863.1 sensor histidine kinase [Leucobacter edaphi]
MTRADGYNWSRPRPTTAGLRGDAALAGALALAATTTSLLYHRMGYYEKPAELWVWILGLALCTLPLALRRVAPAPVAVVVAIGFFVVGQFAVPEVLIVNICLFLALYTVGAWEPRRSVALWTQLGLATALMIWLVVSLIVSSSSTETLPNFSRSGLFSAYATFAVLQIITNLLYFGGAYIFGERAWRTARLQARLEAQGRELERERETSAAQAVALDRIAIARELHDVVAHHVSVMGIQAGAARRTLDRNPDATVSALGVVEDSAQTAIEELRGLVRTLRSPDHGDGATTVGLANLADLVAESQQAEVPATLIIAGEPRPVPMLVDIALYRVVQEALTNVRKHAGRGASAEVRLRFERDAVEVEIGDDGVRRELPKTPGSSGGSGLGLRGMRERIGAVGGSVHTERRERGGFMVRARVPLSERPEAPAAQILSGAAA